MARTIEIDDYITVGNLAELLEIPVSKLIAELFKNGVMATVNEKIDFDTAQIIVGELDLDTDLSHKEHKQAPPRDKKTAGVKGQSRPPVVAMMGHVDHGKTSLLDAIRHAETTKSEAGGITQHLSAYQIEHNKRLLTLLDTPGHEAFAALREHGARLTDLVVIVIAADDGIKPQTLEAIRFARQAGVKMIVAANKMDKPGADINRLKQQLSENDLMPEDWGGETIVLPVSAKTGEGIDELLDMILLVADVEELTADASAPASGLVIESHLEQGRGPVAEALVEHGTLRAGDFISVGSTYGKVRTLELTDGKTLKEATPSTPVVITGLKALPEFGDEFFVQTSEKIAKEEASKTSQDRRSSGSNTATTGTELLRKISREKQLTEFNVVIKADVQGSLTSVSDSLKSLGTEEVAVRIVSSGVGVINESDIHTASTSNAIIYGFHISMPVNIKQLALRDNVSVRIYTVIYELIDDVRLELEKLLEPEESVEELGELTIKGIFKITKNEVICGGQVTKGRLLVPSLARIYRGKDLVAEDLEVTNLKRGPQDVKEVQEGEMCGLSFASEKRTEVQQENRVELYRRLTTQRTL